MTLPLITPQLLREMGACENTVKRLEQVWPNGAKPTLRNLRRAQRLNADLDWFANEYLRGSAFHAYSKAVASARKAYEEAVAPAGKAYEEAVAPAWKAYEERAKDTFVLSDRGWQTLIECGADLTGIKLPRRFAIPAGTKI
ncbi:MAG: hypothetical protein Q8P46_06895 [Hyphomicrobiales bacterium]|nr:hypothetical protein [Hyphomicrobiales bacterium]